MTGMRTMTEEQVQESINNRKEQIVKALNEPADVSPVIVKLGNGRKRVISQTEYKISLLSALLRPNGRVEKWWSDQYNGGPWLEIRDIIITPHNKVQTPSFLDKIKMLKKKKTIEKIKTDKNPLLDKKGIVRIKIFPVSHREVGEELLNKDSGFCEETFIPEEIDCLEVEITPRQLAKAGIDYREIGWMEIQKEEKKSFEESLKVEGISEKLRSDQKIDRQHDDESIR